MPIVESLQGCRHFLGIDLGSTNVRVHVRTDAGDRSEPMPLVLPGSEHGAIPNILRLDEAGPLLSYGTRALSDTRPGRLISDYKPSIGQRPEDRDAQGRPDEARYCPNTGCPHPGWAWSVGMRFCGFCGTRLVEATAVAALVAEPFSQAEAIGYAERMMAAIAPHLTRQLNSDLAADDGWGVAVGIPVHWQEATRGEYAAALQSALPRSAIQLVPEPAAALRYYSAGATDGWTLVVDFGGGTTDLAITNGDGYRVYGERYGGSDFDLVLAHHAAQQLGVDLSSGILAEWRNRARRWKEDLSNAIAQEGGVALVPEVGMTFPVPTGTGAVNWSEVRLGGETFMGVADELLVRFGDVLERALRHFGVAPEEVTQVVLTGGGSHWFFVAEAVRQHLPKARIVGGLEPERAVGKGLTLGAHASTEAVSAAPEARAVDSPEVVIPKPEPEPEPEPEPVPEPVRGEDRVVNLQVREDLAKEGTTVSCEGQTVSVPAGTTTGTRLLLAAGGGAPGLHGGPAGDLYAVISLTPAPAPETPAAPKAPMASQTPPVRLLEAPTPQPEPEPQKAKSSLGRVLLVGAGVLGVVGYIVLAPVKAQANVSARRAANVSNAKIIALGVLMYEADHDDVYPVTKSTATFRQLMDPYVKRSDVYASQNPNGGEFVHDTRYAGKSIASVDNPGAEIMLMETQSWPDGGRHVARHDGSAKFLTPSAWASVSGQLRWPTP